MVGWTGARQGWALAADAVRERSQAGDRDEAAALVTDEMVPATSLIGTEDLVRDRLIVGRDGGVDTVRPDTSPESTTAGTSDNHLTTLEGS